MKLTDNIREAIGLEEDKEVIINARYIEGIVKCYKKISEDEIFLRTERCGKHMLSAIAFRENAKSTFEKTKATFLPSVGFYYSYFHLSIAMLALDYATPIENLEELKHNHLINLVENNLEKKKIINTNFLHTMRWLKTIREKSNYSINPYIYGSLGFLQEELYEENGLYDLMETSFNEAISYIHSVTKRAKKKHIDFGNKIESFIVDSQGEDILSVFFPEEIDVVEEYLSTKFYPGLHL